MPFTTGKWTGKVKQLLAGYAAPLGPWRTADAATIRGTVSGISPYSGRRVQDGAAKVVFNISAAHVPAFVTNPQSAAYLNRYTNSKILGGQAKSHGPDARERIDQMLASLSGFPAQWHQLYYGAIELNGSGIRYYGDMCLVLKDGMIAPTTKVLDRNSFDLLCEPMRGRTHRGHVWDPLAAEAVADDLAGEWSNDLADLAVCKVLQPDAAVERRLTIGAVSEGLIADEDYLEVVRQGSFNVGDLHETRLAPADAAVEGLIADRLRRGPTPAWSELLWRHRRRKADEALKSKRVPVRVIVSAGRLRS